MTKICVAGATGWTGRAIAEAILASDDLELHGALGRSAAGRDLGEVWGGPSLGIRVTGDIAEALTGAQVLVDYSSVESAKHHALSAIGAGAHVVIGTSGLSASDFEDLDAAARSAGVGVVAAGNFSLTAAMAQAAALADVLRRHEGDRARRSRTPDPRRRAVPRGSL